ncbi:MAG: hypothetical protein AAF902_02955 [Chloroflexota bacterium]
MFKKLDCLIQAIVKIAIWIAKKRGDDVMYEWGIEEAVPFEFFQPGPFDPDAYEVWDEWRCDFVLSGSIQFTQWRFYKQGTQDEGSAIRCWRYQIDAVRIQLRTSLMGNDAWEQDKAQRASGIPF